VDGTKSSEQYLIYFIGVWTNNLHWMRGKTGIKGKGFIEMFIDEFSVEFPLGIYSNGLETTPIDRGTLTCLSAK
jgi:hypothetical protein